MIKKYSITELILEVKNLLEGQFSNVLVEGEITNLSASTAGHWYFSLSDKDSLISCAIFKMDALRNPLLRKLKNGDKVLLTGPISVYQKRGTFQIIGKRIHLAGQGDLKLQFELLKKKLQDEGLFDLDIKQVVPATPKRIAVITAIGGAALQDFLNVMKRRSHRFDILVIPAVVQGEKAPSSLLKALNIAQDVEDVEAIVLTRGGGSLEDLWAFNDENLVRAISNCSIPVISAVGHQVDFSLTDYVSDIRVETPTAAAEFLTQQQKDMNLNIQHLGQRLRTEFQELSSVFFKRLQSIKPQHQLSLLMEKLRSHQQVLKQNNFIAQMPKLAGIYDFYQSLDYIEEKLSKSLVDSIAQKKTRNNHAHSLLNAHNPKDVLKRGYTLVYNDKQLIKSRENFKKSNQPLELVFYDGSEKIKKV